ncbi:MAG: flagellar hook-basal body complex protein FliE [Alphaproteobacteria bacterium]|nr:flagellar hook-basal body complex protein FliE [Alphaproteobacteria bacterium]
MGISGINPNAAASAYAQSQNITGQGSVTNMNSLGSNPLGGLGGVENAVSTKEVSFADIMSQSVQQSVQTLRTGEEMAAKAVTGEANLTDVVQAVNNAELTMQAVVGVRDRMISAYQDILRMPI